ncbi:MAG: hypothetical protein M1840_002157 [Geoglossum simile]|nr:MAG: hypothetical protein M1840_002157 [Geoglossum simile]
MSASQHEQEFGSPSRLPKAADRRQETRSDFSVSSRTASLEVALYQNLALEEKLGKEAAEETPQQTLKRLLSTKSAISTSSSFAERQQAAIGVNAAFREIGTGSVGKVFEQPGTIWAFKLPLLDRTDKLWNNYIMHLRIQASFDELGHLSGRVEVPRVAWFANESSDFWIKHINLFPDEPTFRRQPRQVFCMERIFPLPETVRHTLIEVFSQPSNITQAKSDSANKDCLVRPLLGRKRFGASRPGGSIFFSLRNFKLHLDQIQDLGLDAEEYADSMADAMAVLHWNTKIDAMDIEFVLGSSPIDDNAIRRAMPLSVIQRLPPGSSTYEHTTNSAPDFKKRLISLWLLDFDACNDITMDDAGVDQAIKAFLETDAYCPRPLVQDQYAEHLWQTFARRYKESSMKFANGTTYGQLPEKFIQGVVTELARRQEPSASAGRGTVGLRRGPQRGGQRGGAGRGDLGGNTRGGRGRGDFSGSVRSQGGRGDRPGFGSFGRGRNIGRGWRGA